MFIIYSRLSLSSRCACTGRAGEIGALNFQFCFDFDVELCSKYGPGVHFDEHRRASEGTM